MIDARHLWLAVLMPRTSNLRVYQSVPWQIFRSPARRCLDPQNHQTLAPDTLLDQSRIGKFGNEQLKAIDLIRSCEKFAGSRCPYSSILPFTDPPFARYCL